MSLCGQVTGDVPIELVATSVSSDNAYGDRESIVEVVTGDEDEPGFVTDGGENTLLQEVGPSTHRSQRHRFSFRSFIS